MAVSTNYITTTKDTKLQLLHSFLFFVVVKKPAFHETIKDIGPNDASKMVDRPSEA